MLGWFRLPRYELLIESDRITLADNRVRVEVEPRLSVAPSGRVLELLGPVSPAERPQFEERLAAFVAVFRHLIRAAQRKTVFALRPHVRVYGASLLRPLFDGHEQQFLRDALVHAGATRVEFAVSR